MSDDYIKRSDAVEEIRGLVDTMSVCVSMDECNGMRSMKERAMSALERIPAADVRPVKEGYWIENCTDYTCSACGGVVKDEIVYMLQTEELPDYCPNCGAKMGGTP